jgi:hypothetical protein
VVNKVCWSGWWWAMGSYEQGTSDTPMAHGPMNKFDQYVQKKSGQNPGCQKWENENHVSLGCGWCGHCHGWSAASILEPEPKVPLQDEGIDFSVGGLKGILTEYHCTSPVDLFVGTRHWDGTDDTLNAADFHRIVVNWIAKGEPVIMDLNCHSEVWNYPIYDCELTQTPPDNQNHVHVTCKITGATDNVDRDFVGTDPIYRTYTYWIMGSYDNPLAGGWEGSSVSDHPGFIWHPEFGHPSSDGANPIVKYYTYVEELVNEIQGANQQHGYGEYYQPFSLNEYLIKILEAAVIPFPPHPDPQDNIGETRIIPQALSGALISTIKKYKRTSQPLIESVAGNIITGIDIPVIHTPVRVKPVYPEWKTGTWWEIDVQQDLQMNAAPYQARSLPVRMHFEIVGKEQQQGKECYHVVIVYPDRPQHAKFKYSEVWLSKDDRKTVSGLIHIGDTTIQMGDDFLMELLKNAPMAVETRGLRNEMNDLRTPLSPVKIEAFLATRPGRFTYLTSKKTPFPIRIQTPKYTSILVNWG